MKTKVGSSGPAVRADVEIEWSPAPRFGYDVESSIAALYGQSIRDQIEEVAAQFGHPALHLRCVDSGALPFVWRARLETAFQLALELPPPAIKGNVGSPNPKRSRRSRLYVPASSPKLILNAPFGGADAIVFDLEDAVAPDQKREALSLLGHALNAVELGQSEVMVRVNAGAPGLAEIKALANAGIDLFVLPKIANAQQVEEVATLLEQEGSNALLFPLLESALGVENAFHIAKASRVAALSLGLEDYLAELGVSRTESQAETEWAQGRVLNAAVAAGVDPLASVVASLNPDTVFEYARRAKSRGYRGVGCIHPSQAPLIHRAFRPTEQELEWARRIVAAFEQAESGAIQAEGQMVDRPVVDRAMRMLLAEENR